MMLNNDRPRCPAAKLDLYVHTWHKADIQLGLVKIVSLADILAIRCPFWRCLWWVSKENEIVTPVLSVC